MGHRIEPAGDLACHEVHVVHARDGSKRVAIPDAGLLQHALVIAMAYHTRALKLARQARECRSVDIDDGHLVLGGVEHLGQLLANATAPYDDDLHVIPPIRTWPPCGSPLGARKTATRVVTSFVHACKP